MHVPFSVRLAERIPLKVLAVLMCLSAAGTAGFAALSWIPASTSHAAGSEPAIRPARVAEIVYREPKRSLVLAGTVVPRIESTLGFRVAGKIVTRAVDVGVVV